LNSFQSFSRSKLKPLGQRKLTRPVNRTGLTPHLGLADIGPGFPTAAGIFFPTKGTADFIPKPEYIQDFIHIKEE